jgi:CpeT/CpcT family (DUF1001)
MAEAALILPRRRPSLGSRREWASAAVAATATVLAVLCACATQEKQDKGELLALLAVLPGTYDNTAQSEADVRNGVRPVHDAVTLTITHVETPRLGHYVYYVQETAADEPNRVLSQRMFSFKVDEKRGIVETLYELNEPLRWRDGQRDKELFTSMMTTDVQAEGCQLFWKKKDNGFVATHDPKACPTGGIEAEFSAGVLTIGDYKFRKARH